MSVKRLAFAFIAAVLLVLLNGCSKNEETPSAAFSRYIKAWNDQDFEKMYGMLSTNAKNNISKKEFVKRYKDIYAGIEARHLKVTFDRPKNEKSSDDANKQALTYHVKMSTIAGSLRFSGKVNLIKVKKGDKAKWTVDWNRSMLLPGLKEGEFVRVKTIPSKRGEIVDRNGNGLAINGQAVQIGLYPAQLEGHADTKAKLAALLHIPLTSIENALSASWVTPNTFVPIKTVSALDTKTIEQASQLPGVMTQNVAARVYPCGAACAHLTGYIGTITKEQLEKYKDKGYTATSVIGKNGLEQLLEDKLRGIDGHAIVITDEEGDELRTVAEKPAKNGKDVQLTIDVNVQKALYNELKKDTGTAAAIDPTTGDVLALVSAPSFDPNAFALGISQSGYNQLINDPNKPLLNRFSKSFAPGSSIKPLVAAIALKNGTIQPDTTMTITGKTWKKENWKDFHITRVDSLAKVNLRDAIVYSDNIYFARLALKIGGDRLISGLKAFGFTETLPVEYPMDASQISNSGSFTSEAMLANSGYGQGEIAVNPLHLAVTYTAFVNGGNIVKPHLIKTGETTKPSYWKKGVISEGTAKTIYNDMVQVFSSPEGTAYKPIVDGTPPLAGKTGTAELKDKQGEKGTENGWVVAFNTNHPSLEIAMMIEHVENRGGSHYVVGKVKNAFKTLWK